MREARLHVQGHRESSRTAALPRRQDARLQLPRHALVAPDLPGRRAHRPHARPARRAGDRTHGGPVTRHVIAIGLWVLAWFSSGFIVAAFFAAADGDAGT